MPAVPADRSAVLTFTLQCASWGHGESEMAVWVRTMILMMVQFRNRSSFFSYLAQGLGAVIGSSGKVILWNAG